MSRFLRKFKQSVKDAGTPSSVPSPVQPPASTVAPPPQPSQDPTEHGQRHRQVSLLSDGPTALTELWPLRDGVAKDNTELDIVAIHGLNGDLYKTWTEDECFWLLDFLPSDLPNARIFTYGYNSAIAFSGSASRVDDYARYLLARLMAKRREFSADEKRPIIFICHSLGGIVLKKALILAHERSERYSSITKDTFGVIFMGTPHRGSDVAFWGNLFGSIADVLTLGNIRTQLLQDLQPKSSCLGSICSQFVERAKFLRIFTIYERQKIKGMPRLVVDEHSAVMNLPNEIAIPIEADHRSMCRFSSKNSEKYQMVYDCLKEIVDDALYIEQPFETPTRSNFLLTLERLNPEDLLRKLPRPSPGTCAWISESTNFRKWRDSAHERLLWLFGPPGSGKTIAMRYLIESLRRRLQQHEKDSGQTTLVLFFFCNSSDWLCNSRTQVFMSLLYQILSQDKKMFRYLNDSELEEYTTSANDEPQFSGEHHVDFLWKCLSTILQRGKDVRFWIFVDALDELEFQSRSVLLHQLTSLIAQDLSRKVKLAFSDRFSPISQGLKIPHVVLEMQNREEIEEDLRRFVSSKLGDLCADGVIPWRYQGQIEEALLELSEGNFLQASLAWANFRTGVSFWSPEVIKRRLEAVRKISKEAAAFYCSLLARIPEDFQDVAKVGFTWVLGSRKPLNVAELQHAVAISSGQKSWSDLTDSLGFNFEVQLDQAFGHLLRIESDRHVRLAHATVKELLTSPQDIVSSSDQAILSKFRITEGDIDAELAKRCLVVLSFRDFVKLRDVAREALSDRIKDFLVSSLQSSEPLAEFNVNKYDTAEGEIPDASQLDTRIVELERSISQTTLGTDSHTFFSYCVSYWNYHCSQGASNPDVITSLSRFVLLRQSHFFHLIAMLLGMAKVHRGPFWTKIDQFARSPPLHLVMRIGDHPAVVQDLIDRGQKADSMDSHGWTPLDWAILEGRKQSLEILLLESSAVANRVKLESEPLLHLACKGGASVEVMERLLCDARMDINAKSTEGWGILHWCLSREKLHSITSTLLSRKDLDINMPDGNGTTYLDQVFHEGLFEDMALKIVSRWDVPSNWYEREPNPPKPPKSTWWMDEEIEEDPPMSYLHRANSLQWHTVEDLILRQDPTQAIQLNNDEMSILDRYAFHGIEHRLSQILDSLPRDLFEQHPEQGTKLLHLCAQQDWESIVQQLRTKFGVDDTKADRRGRTIAHWASELQWRSISSLLWLKPTSWLDIQAHDGRTALHVAVEHRNQEACKSLLKAGANYLVKDHSGRLPIHVAAEQGHRAIVLLLLQCPIRDYDKDLHGRDLLHFLVMWHGDAFIRQCLKSLRFQIDVRDEHRRTPLHYATIFGNTAAVNVLLEIGANPNLKDESQMTALHHALSAGSLASVQLLLKYGADINAVDRFGRSSLQLGLRSESPELVDFVVRVTESNATSAKHWLRHVDQFGQTVLHQLCLWSTTEHDVATYADEDEVLDLDFDETGEPELTPFHVEKCIQIIQGLGADINARNIHGCTPLHLASKFGNAPAVRTLMRFPDIELSVLDERGLTPLDWAVVDRRETIAEALRSKGGKHSDGWQTRLKPLYSPWQDDVEEKESSAEWAMAPV